MPTQCVVGGCSKSYKDGISMHRWPKDPKLAKLWTKFVQSTKVFDKPSPWSYICSTHFSYHHFELTHQIARLYGYGPKLKRGAVPTLKPLQMKEARPAYQKRERMRILQEILNESVSEHDNPYYVKDEKKPAPTPKVDIEVQVQISPDVYSRGIQVKPVMVSTETEYECPSSSSDEETEEEVHSDSSSMMSRDSDDSDYMAQDEDC